MNPGPTLGQMLRELWFSGFLEIAMKTLADVKFEDFLAWIGAIENMDDGIKEDLLKAMSTVPLIERMMMIHTNAMQAKASDQELQRSSAIINSLVAVYFIMQGRNQPESPRRKSRTRRRNKGGD